MQVGAISATLSEFVGFKQAVSSGGKWALKVPLLGCELRTERGPVVYVPLGAFNDDQLHLDIFSTNGRTPLRRIRRSPHQRGIRASLLQDVNDRLRNGKYMWYQNSSCDNECRYSSMFVYPSLSASSLASAGLFGSSPVSCSHSSGIPSASVSGSAEPGERAG